MGILRSSTGATGALYADINEHSSASLFWILDGVPLAIGDPCLRTDMSDR